MPWSTTLRFSDPLAYAASIQGADIEVLPKARGNFDAELTKIRFDRLWMQRFHSPSPSVTTVAYKTDRKAINFLTKQESPAWLHCGTPILPGDIVVSCGDVIHQRLVHETHGGAMSLPIRELNAAFETLTGREFSDKRPTYKVHPKSALMSQLLNLHETAGRLARDNPDALLLPEVGRALEEQLIHIMVRCLTADDAPQSTFDSRQALIMQRFEHFLEAHPDRPIHLVEICANIGVGERSLRYACEEHLGMGPNRFLALRRMHLARRALLGSDAQKTSVTHIATDYGFWELGRFSVVYRTLFGESPSETLRRPAQHPATYLDRPLSLRAKSLN